MRAEIYEDSGLIAEEMPLNDHDRDWIRHQVNSSLWGACWKLAAALAIPAFFFIYPEWKQMTEFRSGTTTRLDNLDKQIGTLESHVLSIRAEQSPDKVLNEIGSLDQKSFTKALAALKRIVQNPIIETKPDLNLLQQILQKLRQTNESAPEYWPTLLQFLTFASAVFAPPDVPPRGQPPFELSHNMGPVSVGSVDRSVVILDGGNIIDSKFERCRIVFTKNVALMQNVKFIDCVFEMPVTNTPTPFLKKASQMLLASNLKAVSIPTLS